MRGQMTHLDTDVLAEFHAGLITGRRSVKIAAHLAGCDRCAALDDRLAGVSALLASVPAPSMPDSVAQRLEVVLAAEVAKRNYPERAGVGRPGESGAHDRPAATRGFRLAAWRVLVPVGAAVVLLAGGGYGLSLLVGGPGGPQTTSAAAGSAAKAAGSAVPSASSAAAAGSPPGAAPLTPGASARRAMSPAYLRLRVATSQTNFVSGTLGQQLRNELNTPPGATRAASTQTIGCVRGVAGTASLVRVVSARFEGQPAIIIVAREGTGDRAWVVGADCSAASHHPLAATSLPQGISGP